MSGVGLRLRSIVYLRVAQCMIRYSPSSLPQFLALKLISQTVLFIIEWLKVNTKRGGGGGGGEGERTYNKAFQPLRALLLLCLCN